MSDDLTRLIGLPESESLEYKRQFHESTVELLHDLLCLANAYTAGERHIVFGIADDHSVVGIESDPRRRKNSDIQDMLRASGLNRIPDMRLQDEEHDGHTVSVLTIKNRPDKPFFVLRDRREGSSRLRSGVVYTRIGDTNTPMAETAPEDRIELMWRERFGLGLPPLERFRRLLDDTASWQHDVHGDKTVFYHRDFPEFTVADGEELMDDFTEDWATQFPDKRASSYYVELRFHTTVLRKLLFVRCDGNRYRIPAPKIMKPRGWVLYRQGLGWRVAMLNHQYLPLEDALRGTGIELRDGPSEE